LFQSVKRYSNKEDAENAYHDNFYILLEKGMDFENYGEDKIISLRPKTDQNDSTDFFEKSLVYVPKETLDFLGDYDEKSVLELIKVIKSYPIRSIRLDENWNDCPKLFPPGDKVLPDCDTPCDTTVKKTLYYFVLFNREKDREDWQSVRYYGSAAEAWMAFSFFLFLLGYKGNYHVDCDCEGNYRVLVRE